jgi:hypothetical protein
MSPPTPPSPSARSTLSVPPVSSPAVEASEIDFGTRWVDPARPDRYLCVTWEPDSGELRATDTAGSYVRVLAVIPTRAQLDRTLTGWSAVGAGVRPSLAWIEERLDMLLPGRAGDGAAGSDPVEASPG